MEPVAVSGRLSHMSCDNPGVSSDESTAAGDNGGSAADYGKATHKVDTLAEDHCCTVCTMLETGDRGPTRGSDGRHADVKVKFHEDPTRMPHIKREPADDSM